MLFAHRTSDVVWTVGGIDSRPASIIYFGKDGASSSSANDPSQSSKQQKKKKKQRQDEKKVCIADYLTSHVKYAFYFVQHPLKFAATLPCFNMANKDGRLDSFPMETCLIVLDPRYDPIDTTSSPSSPFSSPFTANGSNKATAVAALGMAGVGRGDNDDNGNFIEGDSGLSNESSSSLAAAAMREPHLVQRLANGYKLWPDATISDGGDSASNSNGISATSADGVGNDRVSLASEHDMAAALCRHNSRVAQELGVEHLALAWDVLSTFLTPSASLLVGAGGSDEETEEEDRTSMEEDTDGDDIDNNLNDEGDGEEDEAPVEGIGDDDDDEDEAKEKKDESEDEIVIGKGFGDFFFRDSGRKSTSNVQTPSSLRTSRNHSAGSFSNSRHVMSGGSIGTLTTFTLPIEHATTNHTFDSTVSHAAATEEGRTRGVASKMAALALDVPSVSAPKQATNLEPIELPWLFQETVRSLDGKIKSCAPATLLLN